jgi:hypothetical protein
VRSFTPIIIIIIIIKSPFCTTPQNIEATLMVFQKQILKALLSVSSVKETLILQSLLDNNLSKFFNSTLFG